MPRVGTDRHGVGFTITADPGCLELENGVMEQPNESGAGYG